jgi:hypothetical protein
MKTLNEIRQVLSLQKQSICEIYRITEIGIFGSYARGDETETSDVDILVDYETAPTLIMLVELRDYLSQLFGIKVDIVTKNGLKPRIRERVLAEVVYI